MWFECLPSGAIILVAMAFPHFSAYVINKVAIGNMFRRDVTTSEQKLQYMRDIRLSGHAYKPKGLESIPDA
ncbi:hypothetical protein ABEB36_000973 [Hypothenemus hampei]|uniref:Complex I-MWFE n=1 Tax=Hypothenemus hampei TaxID=57062 RepID=A0ABD1FDW6_HYPHA